MSAPASVDGDAVLRELAALRSVLEQADRDGVLSERQRKRVDVELADAEESVRTRNDSAENRRTWRDAFTSTLSRLVEAVAGIAGVAGHVDEIAGTIKGFL